MCKGRVLIVLGLCVLLSGCGGGKSSVKKVVCDSTYWDGTLGTCLPKGWLTLSREERSQRGLPEDVVAAFQGEKPDAGQYPTVTVTVEELNTEADTPAYSQASIAVVQTLPGYEQVDLRERKVDGKKASVHIFAAQPLPDEPKRRFYQLSVVADGRGYTFTAALPLSADPVQEKEVLLILDNVTLSEEGIQEEKKDEGNEE